MLIETLVGVEPKIDVVYLQTGTEPNPSGLDHLKPRKGLYTILRRPIFQVGRWNGESWPEDKLAQMERGFVETLGEMHPWVTVNHERPSMASSRVENPGDQLFSFPGGMKVFLGFVSRAYRNTAPYTTAQGLVIPAGQLYFNDLVNVAPKLAKAIERGNFLRASVGILEGAEINGKKYPVLQEHVSFEGEWEAVYTLDNLNRWYASANPKSDSGTKVRYYSFNRSDFMLGTNGSDAIQGQTAMDPSKGKTVEDKLVNLETIVAQLSSGLQTINDLLAQVASRLGDAPALEDDPNQVVEEMRKEEMRKEEMRKEEMRKEEMKSSALPALPADQVKQDELESRVAENVRKQFASQIQAQDAEIKRLSKIASSREKEVRKETVKLFMSKHEQRIEPLLRPLAEYLLEETLEVDSSSPGKIKQFHHASSGKQHGLHETLKLFLASRKPVIEGMDAPQLADLDAPADADLSSGSAGWNKHTVNLAVRQFAAQNKVGLRDALRKLSQDYGQNFQRGLLKDAD